jgi:uncharacterized protein (TIGR02118 family)
VITVSVLYPNKDGAKFDLTYYLNKHITMVKRVLGPALKGVTVEQGVGGATPGSKAAYSTVCHLRFDSVQSFQAAFGPHAESIMKDVPNYSSVEPVVQISEVKLS